MRAHRITVIIVLLFFAGVAKAQGVRGQIYLPNGAPLHRIIRFTLTTDDGRRNDILFTDSNGRIEIVVPVPVPYSITVESDGETFDTTTKYFDPLYSRNYIIIHLRPLTAKTFPPPGLVSADATDRNVAPKAKEAYEAALKLIQSQQYEQALGPLKQAIALQPDYFHAHNDLGVVYLKLNQLDKAADALRRAIKLNDKLYFPQLNLSVVYNKLGKHKEAAERLTKLESSHPELGLKVYVPLVEALMGAEQWSQAEEALRRGLALDGIDKVDLKIKLGMVLVKQNKAEKAIPVLQEATAAEPANALAHFNLGTAFLETENLDQAEISLRRAYEIKGAAMPGVQFLLGNVYYQKKDYPKAISAFEAYLRDLPNAPNAAQVKEAIERLRRALKKT
jgi:tetratricopeptide (TPR) repeat protein